MVSFEISFIDILLMIAIAILITLYVTVLIRLKPSPETTIDEYMKKQRKEQTSTPEIYPLETFQKHKTPEKTSKPITIAEAIQMRQTSTATLEATNEPEMPRTTKTPKAPIVYIENQRNKEYEQEVPKTPEKIEAPKTEEGQPPKLPPIQTPTSLTKGSPECAHYFGYLRTLPKNTPIPDECFGCTRIMECFMQG